MVLWQTVSSIGQRSTWFTLLSACRFVEFDTSVCQVFMHCFGSFLLQAMFLSLQVFVFKRQNMKLTVDVVYLYCSHFYNDMGPVPKFRNGKRCWKLEKQNTWLKPEMTSYFDFQDILWPLAFPGHIHRYILHGINDITVLLIWHEYKHYFDSDIRQIDNVCFDALLTFFSAHASCVEVQYAN